MPTINSSQSLVLINQQNGLVVIPAATPLTRLNYFDGKFLRAQDLKVEQDYLRQLVRESNQAGGPGVANGFDLTEGSGDTLNIGQGLAIDPQGRVLLLPQSISVGVQELIDKSRDLQRLFGKSTVSGSADFGDCEFHQEDPPVDLHQAGDLFLIVISSAEAFCGEEDVYGKLCEEACVTSTDRPYIIEGVTIRAVPLVLRTALPSSRARSLTQTHLRSRVASAYFEDERKRVASLISRFGLEQQTWCLGADGAGGSGVAIGVLARAGSETVFLDPWIARRERVDSPAKRYWQWRMMMRPWDVFLAQVLQFQCQLHDLFRNVPTPGKEVDPCSGARGVINEAATTIADLKQFYESTTQRFTALRVNLEEAITFQGGLTRLTDINQKLISVSQTLGQLPQDEFLLNHGMVEVPSAGYLPVTPGESATVNQQVRRLMGGGVDLRFCVVRPDYVAHALEEAQHMERISLVQGLDDPQNKPEVDILVPNGEVLDQKLLSPGNGFEASVDLDQALFSPATLELGFRQIQPMNFRGAARTETLPTGGGAFYLSCEHRVNLYSQFSLATQPVEATQPVLATQPVEATLPGATARPTATVGSEATADLDLSRPAIVVGPIQYGTFELPRLGLWISLRCDSNVFKLSRGDIANFNASAIVADSTIKTPLLDLQFNGVLQIIQAARTTGTAQSVRGHIENAQLSYRGARFGNAGVRTTILVDLDFTATLTAGSAIEILLDHATNDFVLSANWGKEPLEVTASITQKFGPGMEARPTVHATLKENADVLSAKNASHIQALAALEFIAKALTDVNFADAKARLLFPPPPKPTDELIVRGTMDWVMFHRRRTRRCSQEICVPPVAPARQYQVYHLAVGSLQEVQPTRQKLIAGSIPESAFNKLPLVDYAGGLATLLTEPQAWRADWAIIQPGNSIVYGGIANRDSAAADGDTLAISRLGRLVDAVAPVSTPNSQMTTELLSQIPSSIPASSVDGIIFLFTIKAADLRITKTAAPAEIVAGNNITYTLTLTNAGPEAAQNVVLTDPIPANAVFVSAQAPAGWTSSLPNANATGTVRFSIASFAANATASFQIGVKAQPNVLTGNVGGITNTATVASATTDPNAANNTATATTPLVQPPGADLRITKTATSSKDAAGLPIIVYALTVTNAGPATAQGVEVTDPVPANATFVSAQVTSGSGWTPTLPAVNGTGPVVFKKVAVPMGEISTFQIVVRVNATGPSFTVINNTASVTSPTTDPNLSNNQATTTTAVVTPPPLRTARLLVQIDSSTSGARFFGATQPPVITVQFNADGSLAAPLTAAVVAEILRLAPNHLRRVEMGPAQVGADPLEDIRLNAIFAELGAKNLLQGNTTKATVTLTPADQPQLALGGGATANDLIFLIR